MTFMLATTQAPQGGVFAQGPSPPFTITVTGVDGKTQTLQVPRTHEGMQQLIVRRSQLSEQLDNATDRRNGLVEQVRIAPNAAEPGLTAQLKVLNDQVVQLETDLAATNRQISSASPELMAMVEEPSSQNVDDQVAEGVAAGAASMFVVMAVVWLFVRRRWNRRKVGSAPRLPDDTSPRLARLEQGMDAIAIEIERISEGQRFVTRLLSESQGAVAPAQRRGEPTTVTGRDQTR